MADDVKPVSVLNPIEIDGEILNPVDAWHQGKGMGLEGKVTEEDKPKPKKKS